MLGCWLVSISVVVACSAICALGAAIELFMLSRRERADSMA
jgi:hypothetical protein